jgi:hypothetical protein
MKSVIDGSPTDQTQSRKESDLAAMSLQTSSQTEIFILLIFLKLKIKPDYPRIFGNFKMCSMHVIMYNQKKRKQKYLET